MLPWELSWQNLCNFCLFVSFCFSFSFSLTNQESCKQIVWIESSKANVFSFNKMFNGDYICRAKICRQRSLTQEFFTKLWIAYNNIKKKKKKKCIRVNFGRFLYQLYFLAIAHFCRTNDFIDFLVIAFDLRKNSRFTSLYYQHNNIKFIF